MPWATLMGTAELVLQTAHGEAALPCIPVYRCDDRMTIQFGEEAWIRQLLIRKLFTGDYHQEVEAVSMPRVLMTIGRAIFQ